MTKREIRERAFAIIQHCLAIGSNSRSSARDIYANRCYAIIELLCDCGILECEKADEIEKEVDKALYD